MPDGISLNIYFPIVRCHRMTSNENKGCVGYNWILYPKSDTAFWFINSPAKLVTNAGYLDQNLILNIAVAKFKSKVLSLIHAV